MFLSKIGGALAHALGKVTLMCKGKVLVVMSSANALDLKGGKTYSTGYYLNEFVIPYRKLVEAGYEPVIVNPKGDLPVIVVARQLLQGRFDVLLETGIAEISLGPVFPAGPVGLHLLGNRPAFLGPAGEGADPGGVDDREFIDLNLVEGLPLPFVISARGVFSETDELLPAP